MVFGLVLIFFLVIFLLAMLPRWMQESVGEFPYLKGPGLLTPAERSFMGVLEQAVGANFRIQIKVRVADVLVVTPGLARATWQRAFNRISAKHFDFALVERNSFSVMAALELDDSSHSRANRQRRDLFLNGICSNAGLPLIRIPAQRGYNVDEVRRTIMDTLYPPVISVRQEPQTPAPEPVRVPLAVAPGCPKCGGIMVQRTLRSGPRAGQIIWGCSIYPKCRGIIWLMPGVATEEPIVSLP